MALDPTQLANALYAIEESAIADTLALMDPSAQAQVRASIRSKVDATAQAIYAWVLTATVTTSVSATGTTTHLPNTINVAGTAVAQTNPLPVVGTSTSTGSGVGTLS